MEPQQQITTYSIWAACFALLKGVALLRVVGGKRCAYVLDNRAGQAGAALEDWIRGDATVCGRDLVEVYRELITRSRSMQSA